MLSVCYFPFSCALAELEESTGNQLALSRADISGSEFASFSLLVCLTENIQVHETSHLYCV